LIIDACFSLIREEKKINISGRDKQIAGIFSLRFRG
jgi:hypothetical protein